MLVRIGIVTKNRASVLPQAIESALAQDYPDKEVVVFNDASTDATPELVNRFPSVRFVRVDCSIGYRVARNRMMAEPGADLFCSLDDDSWFLHNDALSRSVPLFARDRNLGAIGFEILDEGNPESDSPSEVRARLVDTFIGCGHLLRLSAAREVGFYEEFPAAYGTEEKDLSLRLVDRGYAVVELLGLPVWHAKTMTTRRIKDQHRSGVVNDLAFATLRAPAPEVFALVFAKLLAHLRFAIAYAFRLDHNLTAFDRAIRTQYGRTVFFDPMLSGILQFASRLADLTRQRRPVSRLAYHSYRNRSRGKRAPYALREVDGITVSITTHNRRADLESTLHKIAALCPPPDEIIVCLDGCSDGSQQMLAADWPAVTVLSHQKRQGSIPSRADIFQHATYDLILSIDDDSFPIESDFMNRVRTLFDQRPSLGIVTFPQRSDESPESLTQSDFGLARTIFSYQDSGSVIRRTLYHDLGGYPPFFEHAYEEPDLALRSFEFGTPPLFWPNLTIRHRYTPVERSERRTHHFHASNEALSVILRAPWPLVVPVLLWRMVNQLRYASNRGFDWLVREPVWWGSFASKLGAALRARQPVSTAAYLRWIAAGRSPDDPSLIAQPPPINRSTFPAKPERDIPVV